MSDIFICYSRSDLSIAEQLVQRFRQEGWDVFIDKQTHVGRRWHKEIERELHSTRAIVVLWSAASRDSDFVLEEAEYGKRQNILFPAFIERVEFPYGFSRIQTVDLSNWKNNPAHSDWVALLQSLRFHLGPEQNPVKSEPVSPALPPEYEHHAVHGQTPEPEQPGIKKFLLPLALVLTGIAIFPVAESIYEELSKPDDPPALASNGAAVNANPEQEKQPPVTLPEESPSTKAATKEPQARPTHRVDRKFLPELVPVPAGSFMMGEQNQSFMELRGEDQKKWFGVPGKQIQITQPFYLGKTEITYEQYDYYVQQQQTQGVQIKIPDTATGGRGNQPVANIDWREAAAYASWLSEQTDNQCRLPTEAEWEYAARAGKQTAYPWGNEVGNNNANCDGCGSQWDNKQAAPAGSFAANQFGLYDMSGNVWEWTCSNWRDRFDGSEQQCNDDAADKQPRVVRGGSWFIGPDLARSSARLNYHPDYRNDYIGFRVLCSSPIE